MVCIVLFPWDNLPLKNDWGLSCDRGLDYRSKCENDSNNTNTNTTTNNNNNDDNNNNEQPQQQPPPQTLASLQHRDGANRDFNDQAGIACTKREHRDGRHVWAKLPRTEGAPQPNSHPKSLECHFRYTLRPWDCLPRCNCTILFTIPGMC